VEIHFTTIACASHLQLAYRQRQLQLSTGTLCEPMHKHAHTHSIIHHPLYTTCILLRRWVVTLLTYSIYHLRPRIQLEPRHTIRHFRPTMSVAKMTTDIVVTLYHSSYNSISRNTCMHYNHPSLSVDNDGSFMCYQQKCLTCMFTVILLWYWLTVYKVSYA